MGTKNNPGAYDCYESADPDEPMFILLARDPLAADLVNMWANQYWAKKDADPVKAKEAQECAVAMRAWREENR